MPPSDAVSFPYLYMFVRNSIWSTLIHELFKVKVQVFKDEEELSVTMQHFNKTAKETHTHKNYKRRVKTHTQYIVSTCKSK